jgi:hypothetical protein
MRLEGRPRATAVQAAILRDASRRPEGEGLLLRMRSEGLETMSFMQSIHYGLQGKRAAKSSAISFMVTNFTPAWLAMW